MKPLNFRSLCKYGRMCFWWGPFWLAMGLALSSLSLTACHPSQQKGEESATHLLTVSSSYQCYPFKGFSLCIPAIGAGQNIMALSSLNAADLAVRLRSWMGKSAVSGASVQLLHSAPDRQKAAADLLALAQSKGENLFVISDFFPRFIAGAFNTTANFSGPNCYNTALLASSSITQNQRRYFGLSEFSQILTEKYEKIEMAEASFGDIVVFDAQHSREHAALYLGEGVIFQKKGYRKGFGYRIRPIDAAYDKEPGEWAPSPLSDEKYNPDLEVIRAPRAFYRSKSLADQPATGVPLAPAEVKMMRVIDRINDEILREAPNWHVHVTMGVMAEDLLAQLKSEFIPLQKSTSPAARRAYEQLISLSDQLFMNIDEALYASPYAEAHRQAINAENCYREESPFLSDIVGLLAATYRATPISTDEVRKILGAMRPFDRSVCHIPLTTLVRESKG